jgi:hypothetical protein
LECWGADDLFGVGFALVSLPGANHLMLEQEPAWSVFLEELACF